MATKQDCMYYDWGDTTPREYGAFCKKTRSCLHKNDCENCNSYLKRNEDMEKYTGHTIEDYIKKSAEQSKKLKAYQDTGLTPEEVQKIATAKAEGRLIIRPFTWEEIRKQIG